jgi:hypothetical protein
MQLRVRTGSRHARFPSTGGDTPAVDATPDELRAPDDALGLAVWRMLAEALERGVPPPAVLLLTAEHAHLVDIVPLLKDGEKLDGRGVAGFASVEGVEAMAAVGVLTRRHRGVPSGRFALAFLEWPDGRWWLGRRAVVEAEGPRLVLDPLAEVEVERAVDGASKPGGLGGWFRRVRLEGLRAELHSGVEN